MTSFWFNQKGIFVYWPGEPTQKVFTANNDKRLAETAVGHINKIEFKKTKTIRKRQNNKK